MPQISVLEADMVNGIINSPTSDPLALAFERAGMRQPSVGWKVVFYTDQAGIRHRAWLPDTAVQFRRRLRYTCRYEMGVPFTFSISVGSARDDKAALNS